MKEMKDDEIIDEENLDSIEKINIPTPNRKKIFAVFIIGAIAITTILVVIILSISIGHKSLPKTPKNMILLIGDGFGPTSANLARQFKTDKKLHLDDYLVGTLRTFSTRIITDSAAGATAFSCGNKTNNGFIATTPDNKACGTVMEAAVLKGMKTGIVCTSRLTDATPACFSSHSNSRTAEYFIAKQQVKQNIDVLFGGGATLYDQKDESDVSPIDTATSNGYKIIRTVEEFKQIPSSSKDKYLSVFAAADMSWEIDRDSEKEPSLSEMATKAISLLSNSKTGFFLMIEGSKIDKAGHKNDAATQYRETVEFDNAFNVALEFAKKDGNTLVISIADHETGGLALGRNLRGPAASPYDWYPNVLSDQSKSIDFIVAEIQAGRVTLETAFRQYVGFELSQQDIASVNSFSALNRGIAEVINQKALVGWSSWGHTSLDVDLYCYHVNPDLCAMFSHNNDNTIVGEKISKLFEFDLMEITEKLKEFSVSTKNEKKEFDVYHSF